VSTGKAGSAAPQLGRHSFLRDVQSRFYAAEAAKVLPAFFHTAALTGRTLNPVLEWVADPKHASELPADGRLRRGAGFGGPCQRRQQR
jgi:hypothetical protein